MAPTTKKTKTVIHLTLDCESKEAIKREADRQHTTMSAMINNIGWQMAEAGVSSTTHY